MKLLHSTALLAGALALSACDQIPGFGSGNSSTTTTTTNTTTTSAPAMPAPPAAPAPVPGGPTAAVSGTAQQNFTVVNTTSQVVFTLHVSSVTDQNWGPDILGSSVIAAGATANVTFPRTEAQCNWDIRAVYANGENTELRNINLCQVGTVTLTEN